jgi:hypothetical protein
MNQNTGRRCFNGKEGNPMPTAVRTLCRDGTMVDGAKKGVVRAKV